MSGQDLKLQHLTGQEGGGSMEMTSKNPNVLHDINLRLKELEGYNAKVGWFESSVYNDEKGTPVASVAAIQELGSVKRSIPPRPFMRPAVDENHKDWAEMAREDSKKIVKGEMKPEIAMQRLGSIAQGAVSENIATLTSPPLSPITLGVRKYKSEGKEVTGATIGEIAAALADGTLDVSGVPTKPLEDTGYMSTSLESVVESDS